MMLGMVVPYEPLAAAQEEWRKQSAADVTADTFADACIKLAACTLEVFPSASTDIKATHLAQSLAVAVFGDSRSYSLARRQHRAQLACTLASMKEFSTSRCDWSFTRLVALQRLSGIAIPPDVLLFTTLAGGWPLPFSLEHDPMILFALDHECWRWNPGAGVSDELCGHWVLGDNAALVKALLGDDYQLGTTCVVYIAIDGPHCGLVRCVDWEERSGCSDDEVSDSDSCDSRCAVRAPRFLPHQAPFLEIMLKMFSLGG